VFADAFDDVETYRRSVPADGYLAPLLSKQHFIVVVAMKGDELVGASPPTSSTSSSKTGGRSTSTISPWQKAIGAKV
jgi:hypothetical protein